MIAQEGFIRVDFAGPGGTSMGLRMLGLDSVGVEYEASAVATARAAGFKRWFIDVTSEAVRTYAWLPMWGYCASPECQSFSLAGKGEGRAALAHLAEAAYLVAAGATPEGAVAMVRSEALSKSATLSLEPLLVIRDHRPRWIVLEQVPGVLPLWEVYAEILRGWGYSVDVGILNAEQYGVPQTRKRAILSASLDRAAMLPTPTHSRYYSRTPTKLDDGVQKWVSMAEALGWGMTRRPYPTLAIGGAAGGTDPQALGGSGARRTVLTEREEGRWVEQPADHPLATLGGSAVVMGGVRSSRGTIRSIDEPAPTITSSMDNGNFQFTTAEALRERAAVAAIVEPRVNNQSGTEFDLAWPLDRPAPVVAGRELITMPGANANRFNGSTKSRNDGVRVTVAEAGILQSMPADYPWQGTKTQQFQQVGNMVPALLQAAIVHALLTGPRITN